MFVFGYVEGLNLYQPRVWSLSTPVTKKTILDWYLVTLAVNPKLVDVVVVLCSILFLRWAYMTIDNVGLSFLNKPYCTLFSHVLILSLSPTHWNGAKLRSFGGSRLLFHFLSKTFYGLHVSAFLWWKVQGLLYGLTSKTSFTLDQVFIFKQV